MYHYDPTTALEELKDEAVLPNPVHVRDMMLRAKLDPNAPIGQYRFNATGAAYYHGNKPATTLMSVKDVFDFLGKTERVFVMAGSEELPSIDQASRDPVQILHKLK